MGLPLHQGYPVLYVLAREWMWDRHVLGLLGAIGRSLGVKGETDVDPLDSVLDETSWRRPRLASVTDIEARAAAAAAMGAEVTYGG